MIDKRGVKENNIPLSKNDVRICTDPSGLSKALKRPHHPLVTVEEVANQFSGAKSFTSLDTCSGYWWQLLADDESWKLLTFKTPWGQYGIFSGTVIYQWGMYKLFEGVSVEIILDDFLIHGNNQIDTDQKLRTVLATSRKVGLKFNPKKVKLRVPEVSKIGQVFSAEWLKPDPEKIRAISGMPPPSGNEGILQKLGTVNYLDKFLELKADLQKPISQLTQTDVAFVWEKPQQETLK